VMRKIADRVNYFMLGGIPLLNNELHSLPTVVMGKNSEPSVRTIIKHALIRQLNVLATHRVMTHWEIGGVSSPALLDDLVEIVKGRIQSAALNQDELATITTGDAFRHTRYYCPRDSHSTKEILHRCDCAEHLAREMGLDELYVHGIDVDLIVRRGATPGALRQEIAAALFAKGAVLLTLLMRSVDDWREYLLRADIPPLLKSESFVDLLDLAWELADRRHRGTGTDDRKRQTFRDIAKSGYFHRSGQDKYSVMVVPVMWPKLEIAFSIVGAGDISSSVVAVFSGK